MLRIKVLVGAVLLLAAGCTQEKNEKQETSATQADAGVASAVSPADALKDKGVGPVTAIELKETDPKMAEKGKEIFQAKCTMCHRLEKKMAGPPLKGVTERRSPEWIMNMMLNPLEMTQKDPLAQQLLEEYTMQMIPQDLTQEDARAVLEYLRMTDKEK